MNSNRFAALLLALALFSQVGAQTVDPTAGPRGFIRLMNVVGVGTGKLDFLIDGTPVREQGYQLGDVTGGIPRQPATYKFTFRREGLVQGETTFAIVKDVTVTLIPFAELVPATEDKEAYWTIRILRLKQSEDRQMTTATVVNLTRHAELKVKIQNKDESWDSVVVARLGLARAPIHQRAGYVPMKTEWGDLTPLSVGTSGNFVAIVYEDADGALRSQNFQDLKYLSLE